MNSEYAAECFVEFSIQFALMIRSQFGKIAPVKTDSTTFRILAALQKSTDQLLTMSELAREVSIAKQQLTQRVNSLEEAGLVQRSHSSENRRQVYISLTPRGRQLLAETKQQMAQDVLSFLSCYSESEQEEIVHCLTRLTELFAVKEPLG